MKSKSKSKSKKLKFILSWRYAFLAFALPVAAVSIGFMRLKAAPFGDFALLNMDLWGQYFPMYADQNNHRIDMSLLYSWNGGLGFNAFAQSCYYGNSIFLLLFLFFKHSSMIMVLEFILLSKFGLASLTCFFFLKYKFKKQNIIIVGFSVAYALCAYMCAFITQPMWTDVVILLPLTLMGLEKMLLTKKPLLYCLTLALIIFSSFYIGFSVCIFLILYFLAHSIGGNFKKFSFKIFLRQAKYFAGFSLLAAGLTAFSLLPIYNAIKLTLASDITSPDKFTFYHSLREYFSNMLPFSSVSLEYGVPNIYSGSFVFLLLPLFVLNYNINRRKRIAFSALAVVLYLSLNFNMLDYIWHGFHLPNQLPGRWSFIVSLVVIIMCCEAVIKSKWQSWKAVLVLPLAMLMIYIGGAVATKHETKAALIAITAVLILTGLIILANSQKLPVLRNIAVAAVGLIIIAESGINAAVVISRDTRVNILKDYQFADEKMAEIVSEYGSGTDDFYRMEMEPKFTFNPGMLYNYKGITYYSSTMTGAGYNLFKSLGYQVYASNVSSLYNPDYPALNSMFNIKYLVQRNGNEKYFGFEQAGEHDGYKLLQNKYYLPFAFIADGNLAEWKPKPGENPIQNQNSFMRAATHDAAEIYIPLPLTEDNIYYNNAELTPNDDWGGQYYKRTDENHPVVFVFKYMIDSTAPIVITHGFRAGEISVSLNGGEIIRRDTKDNVINLGQIDAGSELLITVSIENIFLGVWGIELFALDEAAFEYCCEYLSRDTVDIISAGDTKIKCRINSKSGGLLYTSVPAEGWSLKCNGVKIDTLKIGGFLLAAEIPAGESELEFYYNVPGLMPGLIISFLCLIILIFCLYRINIINRIKTKKSPAESIPPGREDEDNYANEEKSFKNFYQKLKKMFKEKDDEVYEHEIDDEDNDEDDDEYY